MVELVCVCGVPFKRHPAAVRPGRTYFHSAACRKASTERPDGTSRCAECKEWLPSTAFSWVKDVRYTAGGHRCAYCTACKNKRASRYHREPQNKVQARAKHDAWRERNLSAGGDQALKWYFTRHLGAYRKKTRDEHLPECDLDADFLLELFHEQGGRCYYTGELLEWNTYGRGAGHHTTTSLSLDRLVPDGGYTRGNVALCGHRTNMSKGSRTEEEFYAFCKLVLQHHEGKG
jgi:hypothetical protein